MNNYNPDIVGHGYLQAAVRVEHRPGWPPQPEDKQTILAKLEALHAGGVQAWWYSVSGKGSFPLFPSKHLPHHPDAVEGMYQWTTEQIHSRDMVAFSWEYMNAAPYYVQAHPEDRMEFLRPAELMPPEQAERNRAHIERQYQGPGSPAPCYLSPYGQRLKDFCVEVVNDLNFDGLWFDGSIAGGVWGWPEGRIGCCCERCARKFRNETGLTMPTVEDWSDPTFRQFIQWRYRFFGEYIRDLCDYVRDHNPTALIAVNNFHSLPHNQGEGMPLHTCRIDGLMATETRQRPYLTSLLMRSLRAVSDRYPPEAWIAQAPGGPNARPDDMIYYGMVCMTAGGFPSFGLGSSAEDSIPTMRAIGEGLKPRAPYTGGRPVTYAAMLLSVGSLDFTYGGQVERPWRSAHGMDNLLRHAHVPVQPILDDQVTAERLKEFAVVVLPDCCCLSIAQADALGEFVRKGGVLIATGRTGTLDGLGRPIQRGALDEILGITARRDTVAPGEIAPAGSWAEGVPDRLAPDLSAWDAPPGSFEPIVWAEFADDVEVLAAGSQPSETGGQVHEMHDTDTTSDPPPAITSRRIGDGRAIYINRDVGQFYSWLPRPEWRNLIGRLIAAFAPRPPYGVHALPHVVAEAWRQEERLVFHVLSEPDCVRSIPGDFQLRGPINLCEIPPSGPVTIDLPRAVAGVSRPISSQPVSVETHDGRTTIRVDGVDRHDVIVVE